jgi:haloalkane dehalogenase
MEHNTLPSWVDRVAYPFVPRTVSVEGAALSYVDEGQGEPIVFAHGTPSWSFEWRHIITALRGRARCIAPDHLGFGLSARPRDADYSPEAHARRFASFVDALGLSRFTLVVHDFGGPFALPLAIAQPERVRRLLVVNSWMFPFDRVDRRMGFIARLAGTFFMRLLYRYANASLRLIAKSAWGDKRKLTRAIFGQYLAPFGDVDGRDRVLFRLARALFGSRALYESLWRDRQVLAKIPSLIVWGLADSALKPPFLARWQEALPEARVVTLPGVGHWPQEEAAPEMSRAIFALLDGAV